MSRKTAAQKAGLLSSVALLCGFVSTFSGEAGPIEKMPAKPVVKSVVSGKGDIIVNIKKDDQTEPQEVDLSRGYEKDNPKHHIRIPNGCNPVGFSKVPVEELPKAVNGKPSKNYSAGFYDLVEPERGTYPKYTFFLADETKSSFLSLYPGAADRRINKMILKHEGASEIFYVELIDGLGQTTYFSGDFVQVRHNIGEVKKIDVEQFKKVEKDAAKEDLHSSLKYRHPETRSHVYRS